MQEPVLIYDRIAANRRKTFLLMGFFFMLVAGVGTAVGIVIGLPVGLSPIIIVFILGFTVFSYYGSSSVALGVSGAHEVSETDEQELHRLVENLCIGSGLPKPKVYIIEDGSMNAFATGRDPDHASIAVTRGLMNRLERRELEGVVAHELSHIGNRDTLVMTTVVVLIGILALLADIGLRMTWFGAGSAALVPRQEQQRAGDHRRRRAGVHHPLADHRATDRHGRLAPARVPRRRVGRLTDSQPGGPGRRPSEDQRRHGPAGPGDEGYGAPLLRQPPLRPQSALNNLFATHPPIAGPHPPPARHVERSTMNVNTG